jgi:transposase
MHPLSANPEEIARQEVDTLDFLLTYLQRRKAEATDSCEYRAIVRRLIKVRQLRRQWVFFLDEQATQRQST